MNHSDIFSYAHLGNVELIEALYAAYQKDPQSIDPSWRSFFEGMAFNAYAQQGISSGDVRVYCLIHAYRVYGHLAASINPLDEEKPPLPNELKIETYGLKAEEAEKPFPTFGLLQEKEATLKAILDALQQTYCGTVGIEYMDYHSRELEEWIQKEIEITRFRPSFTLEQKKELFTLLNHTELFEVFLHTKFVGQKRFSLEGGETLIPMLHAIIEEGAKTGVEECIMGMAHRGRLNVLANILNKSRSQIFGEFEDYYDPALEEGVGDVKYHRGFSADVPTSNGGKVHVALTPNPSHLESVNPVVEGKVRAKQDFLHDDNRKKVIPLIIHGDAALAGQGIIYECMQLYRLPGYTTGGTIHLVINNQIGFTTLPKEGRSTRYCTDIAKSFSAPVFHLNAEDPEACIYATTLALKIRQLFACDVYLDLYCYRKYGHNEGDEPAFTQPIEYQRIRAKPTIREIYRDHLIQAGHIEAQAVATLEEEYKKDLHAELEETKIKKEQAKEEAFSGAWEKYHKGTEQELLEQFHTAVDEKTLKQVTQTFCAIPPSLTLHSKVEKLLNDRKKMLEGNIDWAMAEHLAFATLLIEGVPIRLAGQDCPRGTFSQRHALLVDQKNGSTYFPLAHLSPNQGRFEVYGSPLSEFAALGFEFGYSMSYPSALVLWEAQFGDFANGAQVIIDQYLATSEQKWLRFSGLVLLLPHGYEGQGPEHSSGRIERFLQLSANANIQVVNPTTPAQYFHLLRRQVLRNIRKPLVVFTPKGLLRHPLCISHLSDFTQGSFQEVIDDSLKTATRILLCSGRIFYDLIAERQKRQNTSCAIIRIEQLYPLHTEKLKKILSTYPNCKEICYVQEEPVNMGAWSHLFPQLQTLTPLPLRYIGRPSSASPASGSHAAHVLQLTQLLQESFEQEKR